MYWNKYKTKSQNKDTANEYRYFLQSNSVGVNRLFVLVYSNQGHNLKRYKALRCYLTQGLINNYNVIIIGKKFYDQTIDSNIKRFEEIKKLTTGQGEDYTAGCFLDYEYIKNRYKSIAVYLSRQKVLDADSKAIQQIEFVGQLKNIDVVNADDAQSMFILTILEKIKKVRLKFFQESATVLQKMSN